MHSFFKISNTTGARGTPGARNFTGFKAFRTVCEKVKQDSTPCSPCPRGNKQGPAVLRAALATAIFALVLVACRPAGRVEFRIAHPEVLTALPLILAAESLTDTPVQLQPFSDHGLALAAFLRGDTDLLMTGTTLGIAQANKGVRHWRTFVWGTASVISLKPNIRQIADLRASTVALPFKGSPNDVQLRRILEKLGLEKSIVIQYHPHMQAIALLLQGQVDAVVVPEPMASDLVLNRGARRVAVLAEEEKKLFGAAAPAPMVSLFVLKSMPAARAELLAELERRIHDQIELIQSQPGAVGTREAGRYRVTARVLIEAFKYTRFEWPAAADLRARTDAFLKAAEIPAPPPEFFLP